MKRNLLLFIVGMPVVIATTIFPVGTFGSDESKNFAVKPALSIGYLHTFANTGYSLNARTHGLGGVTTREYDFDAYPSIYLEGKIPFFIGKRLEIALSGSWAIPAARTDIVARDFDPPGWPLGGRTWDSKTNWVTANLQVSYAVVKDACFVKSVSPIVGIRYDYGKTTFDSPHDVSTGFGAAGPLDTADFKSEALQQYFGLAAVFGDFKTGRFGGELKVSLIGGWTPWGKVNHNESRSGGGIWRYDQFSGNLDRDNYFFEVGADFTLFSFTIASKAQGAVSIFTKYSLFHATADTDGTRTSSFVTTDVFDFKMDRSSIAFGVTTAVTF